MPFWVAIGALSLVGLVKLAQNLDCIALARILLRLFSQVLDIKENLGQVELLSEFREYFTLPFDLARSFLLNFGEGKLKFVDVV